MKEKRQNKNYIAGNKINGSKWQALNKHYVNSNDNFVMFFLFFYSFFHLIFFLFFFIITKAKMITVGDINVRVCGLTMNE